MSDADYTMNYIDVVKTTTKNVVNNAKHVNISTESIKQFVSKRPPKYGHWLDNFPWLTSMGNYSILMDIIFAFNSISFCYWGDPKWEKCIFDKDVDGSHLLLMCLKEAVYNDINALKPLSLTKMNYDKFIDMLKGAQHLKYIKERYQNLKRLGNLMCRKYDGNYYEFLNYSRGDVVKLFEIIVNDLSGFKDCSIYNGYKVCYYKRAQLLISDINYCMKKSGHDEINGVNRLTACADYKIPKMLRMFGIISYDETLSLQVDEKNEIKEGSSEENEIRSATIVSIEIIKNEYNKLGVNTTSMNINDDLWILSQTMSSKTKPYHRTRTMKY